MKGNHLRKLGRGDCGKMGPRGPRIPEANLRTGRESFTSSASSASTGKLTFLSSGDQIVALEPKAVEVLLILVEKSGELVARRDLMSAVWPDTFVEESNLSSNISILRKQLGVTPDGGDYIQTIPKRGYRFAAAVKQVQNEPPVLLIA